MITGWITNTGKIIETKPYEHFSDVNDEFLRNIWQEYKEEIDSAYECCKQLSDSGEHGEWHHYEMAHDRCTRWAYEDAYKLGYLRMTPWNYRGELPGIAVEGLPQWIESNKYVLKELQDKYDCKIKIFPAEISKRY